MARILIDGRFVGVGFGDSQTRYVLELIKGIVSFDEVNNYTLLIRPIGIKAFLDFFQVSNSTPLRQGSEEQKPLIPKQPQNPNSKLEIAELNKNLKLKIKNLHLEVLDIAHYSLGEQTKLLKYLNQEKFDLVHFTQFNHPIFYRHKFVTTIQDLTLAGHLHYHNFIKQFAFNLVMRDAARRSQKVIAISKQTMNDIIDFFKVNKERFVVIYHGMDHKRFNAEVKNHQSSVKSFKEKYHINGNYLLYTGMWKKHKNLVRMLKAFEKFRLLTPKDNLQLVLVGKIDKNEPEVVEEINRINKKIAKMSNCCIDSEQNQNNRETSNKAIKQYNNMAIVATGFIDEEELPISYAGALTYIIPSLSEGFGWPPLEAMACGTPVIASKESSIPEICGSAPLYFNPYDIDDIVAKMKEISTNEVLRNELVKKGLEQVKKYDWEETAKKTLEVYEEVLKLS